MKVIKFPTTDRVTPKQALEDIRKYEDEIASIIILFRDKITGRLNQHCSTMSNGELVFELGLAELCAYDIIEPGETR